MLRLLRFRLQSALLLCVVAAILFAWWRDRQELLREIARLENPYPSWDTDQVLGPPDTAAAGDIRTAWASATQDSSVEWLVLEYDNAVTLEEVWVYETYNPGAVSKLSILDAFGNETVVWTGVDPTPTTAAMGISKLPVRGDYSANRIKIYVNSPSVPGWNEIDAVALVDEQGEKHWASKAWASSSYGRNNRLPTVLQQLLQ